MSNLTDLFLFLKVKKDEPNFPNLQKLGFRPQKDSSASMTRKIHDLPFPFLEKFFYNDNAKFLLATYHGPCLICGISIAPLEVGLLLFSFYREDTEVWTMEYLPRLHSWWMVESDIIQCWVSSGPIGRCWAEVGISGDYQNIFYVFSFLLDPFPETILGDMQKSVRMHSQFKNWSLHLSLQTGIHKVSSYVTAGFVVPNQ